MIGMGAMGVVFIVVVYSCVYIYIHIHSVHIYIYIHITHIIIVYIIYTHIIYNYIAYVFSKNKKQLHMTCYLWMVCKNITALCKFKPSHPLTKTNVSNNQPFGDEYVMCSPTWEILVQQLGLESKTLDPNSCRWNYGNQCFFGCNPLPHLAMRGMSKLKTSYARL